MSLNASTESERVKAKPKLEVLISYNGMNDKFTYEKKQEVLAVRHRALDHYKIKGPERDENFLFGPDNQTEIPDGAKMGEVVSPGSQLHLHRRAAGGGRS